MLLALATAVAIVAAAPVETGTVLADSDAPVQARLSLVFGAAARSARLDDGTLPVRYSGFAPAQLRLSMAYFAGSSPWGFGVDAAGEWFRATGKDLQGNEISLPESGVRGSAAFAGHWQLVRSLTLEGQLGYGFGQMPALDASGVAVIATRITHHGPLVAALLSYDGGGPLGFGATLRGRASPFALSAVAVPGKVALSDYALGAELAFGRFAASSLRLSAILDYELTITRASRDGFTASLVAHRFSAGLRVTLPREVPAGSPAIAAGPGRIQGQVLVEDGRSLGSAATVEVVGGARLTLDEQGRFELPSVDPGKVRLRASAAGYKAAEQEVEVPPGGEVKVSLTLLKPSGPGTLRGFARTDSGKAPVADVTVEAGGKSARSGADGAYALSDVGPGPVRVSATSPGYQPVNEVVAIPPGGEATLDLMMVKAGAKALATLRGLVRSTQGAPVQASIKIREASASAKAGLDGRFLIRLPGGVYTVVIEAKGFVTQTKTVQIGDGDQAIFHCDLEPASR